MAKTVSWKQLLTETLTSYFADRGPRLGAALAFYATFSIAPLLVMAAALSSLFFSTETVQAHVKHELIDFAGADATVAILAMVDAAQKSHQTNVVSSCFGVVALLIGATGVFIELKDSMNAVWEVDSRKGSTVLQSVFSWVLAIGMVVVIAFLLLLSMILTSVLISLSQSVAGSTSLAQVIDLVVSTTITTLLFTFIFKYLPDVKINWEDVWIGGLSTAFLFAVGKHLIGLYMANMVVATAYGAMSSIVVFLLWMYYSFQILLLGAEFTRVYAQLNGRQIQPSLQGQWKLNP